MRRKTLYLGAILSVFLLVMSFSVSAQTETKKYSTATNLGLYGSYTWDIAVDQTDNNNVYLATYYSPNGFFYSQDGGTTWSGLPIDSDHGAGRAVEVNPTNGHVYALLNDLLISTNNFSNYEVAYEFNNSATDLHYSNGALYVSVNDSVYRTDDEGGTFTINTVCANETVWSLANNENLFALCHNYNTDTDALYISSDDGENWSDLDIASDGITQAEQVVVNSSTGHLFLVPSSLGGSMYRSTDDGATWLELDSAPATGHLTFDSNGRAYSGWYYSDDEGVNWTSFGTGGDYNHLIYPDPTDPTILYDTTTPGFQKSTDSGATWTSSVENITGVEVTSVAQTTDKETVWVATQNGPAKTNNFSADEPTWSYAQMDNFNSSGYDAVWVKPTDGDTAVYSSSMNLSYTTDGGTTWTNSTVSGVTLTGAVFQIINDVDGYLYGVVGPNTSAGSQTGGVIKSTDEGVAWTSLSFTDDKAARSIDVDSEENIYVGGFDGLYKYDGSSWAKLDAPDDEFRAVLVNPENEDTVYALSSENGFYKSTDAGESWTKSNSGLGGTANYTEFNALTVQTSNTLYLSGVRNSDNKGVIFKSADGGETWDQYYVGKKSETFKALLFDGLLAGNSRGLYDMRTRVSLKIKADKSKVEVGDTVKYTITLTDKATGEPLANRKIKLYRTIGAGNKTYWKTVRTNENGKKVIYRWPRKKLILTARWKRNATNQEEYASPGLKSATVKIK